MHPEISDAWAAEQDKPADQYPWNLGRCSLDWDYEPRLPPMTQQETDAANRMLANWNAWPAQVDNDY